MTTISIFDEYDKWRKKENNPIKELPIVDKNGKRLYDTKYKGEVRTVLMIYKVDTDTKIGYGILKTDDIYKCFNNELKNSFFTSFTQSDNSLKVIPRK